jgi:cold shock CspA family protein
VEIRLSPQAERKEVTGMKGRVIKLVQVRRFGFVRDAGGEVIFFQRSESRGADFDALEVGTNVEFDSEKGAMGLRAMNIQPKGDLA